MVGPAAQIAEAEAKLANVQEKLEEIEVMKAMEPKLRRDIAALVEKIEELKNSAAADKSEKSFFAKDAEGEEEEEKAPQPKQAAAKPKSAKDERLAKLKAINKKLKQIEVLRLKENLDDDAKAKVASEPKLRKQLAAIEAGEDYVDSDVEQEEAPPPPANFKRVEEPEDNAKNEHVAEKLPTDPAEVEKRLKNLKKKLQQIDKLKEKKDGLDEEAKQKLASEDRILQEVAALEEGKDEFVYVEKSSDEIKNELEKKMKNLNKKLEAIQKLKQEDKLDADGAAKVASEGSIKSEVGELQRQIAELNKQERERVAQRLGWESEVKEISKEQKASAKKKGKK